MPCIGWNKPLSDFSPLDIGYWILDRRVGINQLVPGASGLGLAFWTLSTFSIPILHTAYSITPKHKLYKSNDQHQFYEYSLAKNLTVVQIYSQERKKRKNRKEKRGK